jgi:glucose-6-phosphate isomerase
LTCTFAFCANILIFPHFRTQPLSIVFGWSIVQEFIAGAHDMDRHFVETNLRHNVPVLLALLDVWNDSVLKSSARIVTPFAEAFAGFPAFVAGLESQTCGERTDQTMIPDRLNCAAMVVDGSLDESYDRALYRASTVMNSELLMVMDSQVDFNTSRTIGLGGMEDVHSSQDALTCSLFAHADELAFGFDRASADVNSPGASPRTPTLATGSFEGNRPSSLLMVGKLDAFACGQLVALSEHRAVVKAHIWGLNAFVKETGSSLHMYRTDKLKTSLQELLVGHSEDEDKGEEYEKLNLSTKTLLDHYASVARSQRINTVHSP